MAVSHFEFQHGFRNVAARRFNGERTCGEEEPENQRFLTRHRSASNSAVRPAIAAKADDPAVRFVAATIVDIVVFLGDGDDRRHANLVANRIWRSDRRRAASAAGLRRASETGRCSKLAHEKPGQTLQATALVHEAYLRLVDGEQAQHWNSRGHFFAAAAEAMRRILVENARRKAVAKARWRAASGCRLGRGRSGSLQPIRTSYWPSTKRWTSWPPKTPKRPNWSSSDIFAGLTVDEAADALGISRATANRHWTYARAWLRARIADDAISDRRVADFSRISLGLIRVRVSHCILEAHHE